MLSKVSRKFPGVEKRLLLTHPAYPEPSLGEGKEGLGLQVSDIMRP
jgi:hypothetical protein